jgi:hypothetical protein
VSLLFPNKENKQGYGLQIFFPAKATTKWLENQSNQGCVAEAMQQLEEILRLVNPFTESYNRIHEMQYMNKKITCIDI